MDWPQSVSNRSQKLDAATKPETKMNVLSKAIVDTRESVFAGCLAVLHILRLDRLARFGVSTGRKLVPRWLWFHSKAITSEQEETADYDHTRLPLSPVKIDRNGVETYEAVRALPYSQENVDEDGVETFEAVVSTSDSPHQQQDQTTAQSGDLNGETTKTLPLSAKTVGADGEEAFDAVYSAPTQPSETRSSDLQESSVKESHKRKVETVEGMDSLSPPSKRTSDGEMAADRAVPPIGDLVECESAWATTSKNLLAEPSEPESVDDGGQEMTSGVEERSQTPGDAAMSRVAGDRREMVKESSGLAVAIGGDSPAVSSSTEETEPLVLEESSVLAQAIQSPLPESENDNGNRDAMASHKLPRTDNVEDLLEESHRHRAMVKPHTAPTVLAHNMASQSDPVHASSSPEASAMSLISPSHHPLRVAFLDPTKAGESPSPLENLDAWKLDDAQRETRVSARTNETEDMDADRQSEDKSDSEDASAAAQRGKPLSRGGAAYRPAQRYAASASRAESEVSDADDQSVASMSGDEAWNSEDEQVFNAAPPFMGQRVSSLIHHTV